MKIDFLLKSLGVIYGLMLFMSTIYSYNKAILESFCFYPSRGTLKGINGYPSSSVYSFKRCDQEFCGIYKFSYHEYKSGLNTEEQIKGLLNVHKLKGTKVISEQVTNETIRLVYLNQVTYYTFTIQFSEIPLKGKIYQTSFNDLGVVAYQQVSVCKHEKCGVMDVSIQYNEKSCEIGNGLQYKYLVITLISISLLMSAIMLSVFNIKVKIMIHKVLFLFSAVELHVFCNPIDGLLKKVKKGQNFYVFANQTNMSGHKSSSYFSKNICLSLEGGSLLIYRDSRESRIQLSTQQVECMERFIFLLNCDPKNWVSNGVDHYLSVDDFLKNLRMGKLITSVTCEKDSYVADNSLVNLLAETTKYPLKVLKMLCAHNENFFKCRMDNALILAVNRKVDWRMRPKGVGNSQWKRYCSDLSSILLKMGLNALPTQYSKPKPLTEAAVNSLKDMLVNSKKVETDESVAINYNINFGDTEVLEAIKNMNSDQDLTKELLRIKEDVDLTQTPILANVVNSAIEDKFEYENTESLYIKVKEEYVSYKQALIKNVNEGALKRNKEAEEKYLQETKGLTNKQKKIAGIRKPRPEVISDREKQIMANGVLNVSQKEAISKVFLNAFRIKSYVDHYKQGDPIVKEGNITWSKKESARILTKKPAKTQSKAAVQVPAFGQPSKNKDTIKSISKYKNIYNFISDNNEELFQELSEVVKMPNENDWIGSVTRKLKESGRLKKSKKVCFKVNNIDLCISKAHYDLSNSKDKKDGKVILKIEGDSAPKEDPVKFGYSVMGINNPILVMRVKKELCKKALIDSKLMRSESKVRDLKTLLKDALENYVTEKITQQFQVNKILRDFSIDC